MKLICVEEHAVDQAITRAAQPALDQEAPYFRLTSTGDAVVPADSRRPTLVRMDEAVKLGADLGAGWHHEAGIHVLRLILSGAFERFPGLQVISGHWGEMVPFYLQRLDDTIPPKLSGLSRTISETYRGHVWVTPSGMFNLPHFEFIRAVIGVDRIIWSVDYPYLTLNGTRQFLDELPVIPGDKDKITHRNAEGLLRL